MISACLFKIIVGKFTYLADSRDTRYLLASLTFYYPLGKSWAFEELTLKVKLVQVRARLRRQTVSSQLDTATRMVTKFLLVGKFQLVRKGVVDDIEGLESCLGFLVSLIKGLKNGLKQKVKDNFISVLKKNPQSCQVANLSSCWEEEPEGEKERKLCHLNCCRGHIHAKQAVTWEGRECRMLGRPHVRESMPRKGIEKLRRNYTFLNNLQKEKDGCLWPRKPLCWKQGFWGGKVHCLLKGLITLPNSLTWLKVSLSPQGWSL